MPQPPRRLTLRYAVPLLAIAVATGVRMLLDPTLGRHLLFAPFFVAALFSAWYGGFGPALVAVVVGLSEVLFFFLPHDGSFKAHGLEYPMKIGYFAAMGLTTAALFESLHVAQRRARASAEQAIAKQHELEREIAERRQAQEALRRHVRERKRMEEEIRRQAEVLRETDRRKDEFLALLAHELRNPLAPILMAVHIMKKRGMDAARLQWARDVVQRQVQQMTRLVDDLLDVSRITSGKIRLRKEVVGLAAVVSRALETSGPLFDERQQELTVALPAEAIHLEGDPARLEQMLVNLLNNAAKYTERGGRIRLAVSREAGGVVLRVKDSGIGIRADMLACVFEPFVQADRALSRAQGGLGIGLALVKRLVELHAGSISAHSDGPNQGSEFVVRLPLWSAPPGQAGAAMDEAADASRKPPAARRILVVDDNLDSADCLAMCLKLEGHEVFVASDGATALEVVPDFRPDVVLSDIGMPGMDGYELARRIKEMPGMERVLLVAVTGWGQEGDRRRSQLAGFDRHLVKPVAPEAVQKLVEDPQ